MKGEFEMKKWQVIGLSLCCAILLAGCQKQAQHTAASKSETSTSQTVKKSQKVTKTSQAKVEKEKPSDESLYANTLDQMRNDKTESHAAVYCFYDLNKDKQNELIFANYYNNQPSVVSVYTLINQQATELGHSYTPSAGGYRSSIQLYQDGSIYFEEGQSTSPVFHGKLLRLTNNRQIQVLKEQDYSYQETSATDVFATKDQPLLALDQLPWQSVFKQMDPTGLTMLQFASIEGSWGNGKYQISKDQIISDNQRFVLNGVTIEENGAVKAGFYTQPIQEQSANDSYPIAGGSMIYFIPKGVDMSTTVAGATIQDASDHQRDRIWTGQSTTGFADASQFIYKD